MEHSCSGDGRQTARGAARNYTRPRPCGRAWTNRAEAAEQPRETDRAAQAVPVGNLIRLVREAESRNASVS